MGTFFAGLGAPPRWIRVYDPRRQRWATNPQELELIAQDEGWAPWWHTRWRYLREGPIEEGKAPTIFWGDQPLVHWRSFIAQGNLPVPEWDQAHVNDPIPSHPAPPPRPKARRPRRYRPQPPGAAVPPPGVAVSPMAVVVPPAEAPQTAPLGPLVAPSPRALVTFQVEPPPPKVETEPWKLPDPSTWEWEAEGMPLEAHPRVTSDELPEVEQIAPKGKRGRGRPPEPEAWEKAVLYFEVVRPEARAAGGGRTTALEEMAETAREAGLDPTRTTEHAAFFAEGTGAGARTIFRPGKDPSAAPAEHRLPDDLAEIRRLAASSDTEDRKRFRALREVYAKRTLSELELRELDAHYGRKHKGVNVPLAPATVELPAAPPPDPEFQARWQAAREREVTGESKRKKRKAQDWGIVTTKPATSGLGGLMGTKGWGIAAALGLGLFLLTRKSSAATPPGASGGQHPSTPDGETNADQLWAGGSWTVKAGDSLSNIAAVVYKNMHNWRPIYDANRELIGDNPNLIRPGMVLVIPSL